MRRVLSLVAVLLLSGPAAAQTIRLSDDTGQVAEGELLDFDGRYYRLLGPYGEITLDGSSLTCAGDDCPRPDVAARLRISGAASVVSTVLPALLETYARRRELDLAIVEEGVTREYTLSQSGAAVLKVALAATSSAEGLADLIADAADLAVTTRLPNATEQILAREAGRGDLSRARQRTIIGLDAAVAVIGDTSTRRSVAPADMDNAISVHVPTGDAQEAILSILPGGRPALVVPHPDRPALDTALDADPEAVGLVLFSELGGLQAIPIAGACGAGADASQMSIKTEDYPLVLPVYLFSPGRRLAPAARDFVDYVTSPIAQPVIRRAGLVDQFPQTIPFGQQGDRIGLAVVSAEEEIGLSALRRMVQALDDRTRLTLTFRFRNGSSALDAQSMGNVERLAETLRDGIFQARRLVFVGFTDREGSAAANQRVSLERATAVRDAVAALAPGGSAELAVEAYGEALPMACDDTDWGKRVNRRVELWLE
ncbi:Outer membrane porin F precursor [Rhodobacteraceae bacterium THAF1]|nr:Outer membrane porin F precursor [Palleronia sp. THAF1]VDC16751.1 Outer membrane porin F precursor [Rhodobacteraceae bacterium THAF1]